MKRADFQFWNLPTGKRVGERLGCPFVVAQKSGEEWGEALARTLRAKLPDLSVIVRSERTKNQFTAFIGTHAAHFERRERN